MTFLALLDFREHAGTCARCTSRKGVLCEVGAAIRDTVVEEVMEELDPDYRADSLDGVYEK